MNNYAILADRTKPIGSTGFDLGNKSFAGLPKVRTLYYFLTFPSNTHYPLGVSLSLRNKKKYNADIDNHPFKMRGKGKYTSFSGH